MTGTVVLLHGFMNKSIAMRYIERGLNEHGLTTLCFNYQTNAYGEHTLKALDDLISTITEGPIYLVGHSMGGLVLRNYLDKFGAANKRIKALITIGTPHNRSQCAENFSKSFLKRFFGTAGESGLTKPLTPWKHKHIKLGCIAGVSQSLWTKNWFLGKTDEKNDGTILVKEAFVSNADDKVCVYGSHTGMLVDKLVVQQCISFISSGSFIKTETSKYGKIGLSS